MSDIFNVPVPEDDLTGPSFTPPPTGEYVTTFEGGATKVTGNNGWEAIAYPLRGLANEAGTIDYANFTPRMRYTTAHDTSEKAVEIGRRQNLGLAKALGLTTETTVNGKKAVQLAAASVDEFIEQVNACAGTKLKVYMVTGPRKPKFEGDTSHLKDDGTPWIDSEVARVIEVA